MIPQAKLRILLIVTRDHCNVFQMYLRLQIGAVIQGGPLPVVNVASTLIVRTTIMIPSTHFMGAPFHPIENDRLGARLGLFFSTVMTCNPTPLQRSLHPPPVLR